MHRNEGKLKQNPKPVGHCKSSAKGKVHSNTGIPQEIRKKSNKKPNRTGRPGVLRFMVAKSRT